MSNRDRDLRISVIIPVRNAAHCLETTLKTLSGETLSGETLSGETLSGETLSGDTLSGETSDNGARPVDPLIGEIILIDGGSSDTSMSIGRRAGCRILSSAPNRGQQLALGAAAAARDWFLFIHADTLLSGHWRAEVERHLQTSHDKAGIFRFRLDDPGWRARILEKLVTIRCHLFALPYGDQGLLISRNLYHLIGGYSSTPLMEDVEIIRKIGRSRLVWLDADAITSAVRYRTHGYARRSMRNLLCLGLYFVGVAPEKIVKLYSGKN